jgi:hypothetical protein
VESFLVTITMMITTTLLVIMTVIVIKIINEQDAGGSCLQS